MTATSPRGGREFGLALIVALGIHLVIFLGFVLLMVLSLLAGKVVEIVDEESKEELSDEITLVLEDIVSEQALAIVPTTQPFEPPSPPPPASKQDFTVTEENEDESPENAPFIGAGASRASSDEGAVAGDKKTTALAGKKEVQADVKTQDTRFTDGALSGQATGKAEMGKISRDSGDAEKTQKEIKTLAQKQKPAEEENPPAETFIDPDHSNTTLEDQLPKPKKEKPPEETAEEDRQNQKPQKETKAANASGGFQRESTKTRVRGVLNAKGRGSLNVKNSAIGRYETKVFALIERQWQTRNYQFRSHLAPGVISIRFIVDAKGAVSGQRLLDKKGASQIQWGLVIQSVSAAKLPKMPAAVLKELDGEPLELILTFNYN